MDVQPRKTWWSWWWWWWWWWWLMTTFEKGIDRGGKPLCGWFAWLVSSKRKRASGRGTLGRGGPRCRCLDRLQISDAVGMTSCTVGGGEALTTRCAEMPFLQLHFAAHHLCHSSLISSLTSKVTLSMFFSSPYDDRQNLYVYGTIIGAIEISYQTSLWFWA